jgi:hypothetical protein
MVKILGKEKNMLFTEEQKAFLLSDEEFSSLTELIIEFKKRFSHFRDGSSIEQKSKSRLYNHIRMFLIKNKQI